MAKFPLEMANGEQVRKLEELKKNFDIEKVVGYFLNGKLQVWLAERYYEEKADAVSKIDKEDPELVKKLCEIFGVTYTEEKELDTDEIARYNERIARLKQFTDDEEIIRNVECVAFNQEELAELYDRDVQKIYLCEGEFHIPKSKQNVEYVLLGDAGATGLIQKEEPTDNAFSNDISHTPILCEHIKQMKTIINREGSLIFYRPELSISVCDMYYAEEDVHTRYEIEKKAENMLNSLHDDAQNFLSTYSNKSLYISVSKELYNYIKPYILELADTLYTLDEEVRKKNTVLLDELHKMLELKAIQDKIEGLAKKEMNDSYYKLPNASSYSHLIEYDSCDHDPPGLFGKKDWSFMGGDAWLKLDNELQDKAEFYNQRVSDIFKYEVLNPIVDLLERIKISRGQDSSNYNCKRTLDKENQNFDSSNNSVLGLMQNIIGAMPHIVGTEFMEQKSQLSNGFTTVYMPRQGQAVESCIIAKWHKKQGDSIKKGDVLFTYETDKATFDEEAKVSGILHEIFFEEGMDVPCLSAVCIIKEDMSLRSAAKKL